jgi:hypothetical protein
LLLGCFRAINQPAGRQTKTMPAQFSAVLDAWNFPTSTHLASEGKKKSDKNPKRSRGDSCRLPFRENCRRSLLIVIRN